MGSEPEFPASHYHPSPTIVNPNVIGGRGIGFIYMCVCTQEDVDEEERLEGKRERLR